MCIESRITPYGNASVVKKNYKDVLNDNTMRCYYFIFEGYEFEFTI